jgi:hypothetical protein
MPVSARIGGERRPERNARGCVLALDVTPARRARLLH